MGYLLLSVRPGRSPGTSPSLGPSPGMDAGPNPVRVLNSSAARSPTCRTLCVNSCPPSAEIPPLSVLLHLHRYATIRDQKSLTRGRTDRFCLGKQDTLLLQRKRRASESGFTPSLDLSPAGRSLGSSLSPGLTLDPGHADDMLGRS